MVVSASHTSQLSLTAPLPSIHSHPYIVYQQLLSKIVASTLKLQAIASVQPITSSGSVEHPTISNSISSFFS